MLKRTMILLGLTITVGALLLVVGCGGHNAGMPIEANAQNSPSRQVNSPPEIKNVGMMGSLNGDRYLIVLAVDPDNDRVQYKVTINPGGLTFDQSQSSSNWVVSYFNQQPANDYPSGVWGLCKLPKLSKGSYEATFQAKDPQGSNIWGPEKKMKFTILK